MVFNRTIYYCTVSNRSRCWFPALRPKSKIIRKLWSTWRHLEYWNISNSRRSRTPLPRSSISSLTLTRDSAKFVVDSPHPAVVRLFKSSSHVVPPPPTQVSTWQHGVCNVIQGLKNMKDFNRTIDALFPPSGIFSGSEGMLLKGLRSFFHLIFLIITLNRIIIFLIIALTRFLVVLLLFLLKYPLVTCFYVPTGPKITLVTFFTYYKPYPIFYLMTCIYSVLLSLCIIA